MAPIRKLDRDLLGLDNFAMAIFQNTLVARGISHDISRVPLVVHAHVDDVGIVPRRARLAIVCTGAGAVVATVATSVAVRAELPGERAEDGDAGGDDGR